MIYLFLDPICYISSVSHLFLSPTLLPHCQSWLQFHIDFLTFRSHSPISWPHSTIWACLQSTVLLTGPGVSTRPISWLTPCAVMTGSWVTARHYLVGIKTSQVESWFPQCLELWISIGMSETGHQSQCQCVSGFLSVLCSSLQNRRRSYKWISGAIKAGWQ